MSDVADLQRWFQRVVTDPGGAAAGAASDAARAYADGVEAVVLPSASRSAAERIGVYADMYWLRLLDVLEQDFPAVRALLGSDAFHRRMRAYLAACPSTHYSLNALGARLPAWLRQLPDGELEHRAFAAELAELERAIQEVFDAPEAVPLEPADVEAVPPGDWAEARLELLPALRLLAFEHPVNAWFQAFKDGRPGPVPAPVASHAMVFRHDDRVWRADLTREQHAVLAALADGDTLAGALASAAAGDEAALAEVGAWFRRWGALGLFVAIRVGDGPAQRRESSTASAVRATTEARHAESARATCSGPRSVTEAPSSNVRSSSDA